VRAAEKSVGSCNYYSEMESERYKAWSYFSETFGYKYFLMIYKTILLLFGLFILGVSMYPALQTLNTYYQSATHEPPNKTILFTVVSIALLGTVYFVLLNLWLFEPDTLNLKNIFQPTYNSPDSGKKTTSVMLAFVLTPLILILSTLVHNKFSINEDEVRQMQNKVTVISIYIIFLFAIFYHHFYFEGIFKSVNIDYYSKYITNINIDSSDLNLLQQYATQLYSMKDDPDYGEKIRWYFMQNIKTLYPTEDIANVTYLLTNKYKDELWKFIFHDNGNELSELADILKKKIKESQASQNPFSLAIKTLFNNLTYNKNYTVQNTTDRNILYVIVNLRNLMNNLRNDNNVKNCIFNSYRTYSRAIIVIFTVLGFMMYHKLFNKYNDATIKAIIAIIVILLILSMITYMYTSSK